MRFKILTIHFIEQFPMIRLHLKKRWNIGATQNESIRKLCQEISDFMKMGNWLKRASQMDLFWRIKGILLSLLLLISKKCTLKTSEWRNRPFCWLKSRIQYKLGFSKKPIPIALFLRVMNKKMSLEHFWATLISPEMVYFKVVFKAYNILKTA